MLTHSSLAFLHGGRTIRRVRSDLLSRLQAEPAARLLPGLLDIPVAPAPIPDPAAILAHPGGIALCGPPLSGRSLALLQIQRRWVAAGARSPLIALSLTAADAPNLSPRAVVAGAIHHADLPASYADGGRPMILLLDGWEELPSDRRALWRSYITAAAAWPVARVVVSLPPGESCWPGLTSLSLVAPDDDDLAVWLGRLLPSHDPAPILAALGHEPLASLRDSAGDLLLLALAYPLIGLPASRAHLYEQAYALARPLLDEPAAMSVGRAALRHYRLARGLAGGEGLATLTILPAHEIAAVAPLAAGLLDDPRPVLDLLWAAGSPSPAALRGLAACLRERPAVAADRHLRLIELLLARADHAAAALIAPAMPDMFAAIARGDQARAMRALNDITACWPDRLSTGLLLSLVDRRDVADELRWAAADLLAAGGGPPDSAAEPPPAADAVGLAARAHVIGLAAPALRARLLDPALRPGLAALLGGLGGEQRRAAAAAALLDDATAPGELRALALAGASESASGLAMIQRSLSSPSSDLRRSALGVLLAGPAGETLSRIAAAMAEPGVGDAALRDLLESAAALPQPEATGLIARQALAAQRGLGLRLAALRLLSSRPGGAQLLLRFMAVETMPEPLRAAAARMLGGLHVQAAPPLLRQALLGAGRPLLRRAAAAGLAELALDPATRAIAVAALIDALAQPDIDTALTARVAAALGAVGSAQAIPALSTLLHPYRASALRATWLAAAPELGRTPAEQWPALALDPATRAVLLDSLAVGETAADPPSSLAELGDRQAELAAVAAAEALADIAQLRPALVPELCSRIRQAILATSSSHAPRGLLGALARAAGAGWCAELEALLDASSGTPALRWAAIDQLARTPEATEWILGRLRSARDDAFTGGKLIEALGDLADPQSLPALRAIVADQTYNQHLRASAIVALGRVGGGEVNLTLLQIAKEHDAPATLRVAAIAALPQPLTDEARHALRRIARATGVPSSVITAMIQRLARAGDREVLPLLLRAIQGEQQQEVLAAISAAVDLGDQGAAPTLVRISQSPIAAPSVRLAAIDALLHLEGPVHLALIRPFTESPLQPLRIKAFQIIARADPDDPHLVEPMGDVSAPLALRLAAIEHLIARAPALDLPGAIVSSPGEPPQLRLRAVAALARLASPEAARALHAALGAAGPPLLRRHCIAALAELAAAPSDAGAAAEAIIADLAQRSDGPAEDRYWAAAALLDRTLQKDIL